MRTGTGALGGVRAWECGARGVLRGLGLEGVVRVRLGGRGLPRCDFRGGGYGGESRFDLGLGELGRVEQR